MRSGILDYIDHAFAYMIIVSFLRKQDMRLGTELDKGRAVVGKSL